MDGELDALTVARAERICKLAPPVNDNYAKLDLRAAIKTATPYFKAPASLHNRIHAELHKTEKSRGLDYLNTWRWPTVSAVASSVVLFSMSLVLVLNTPSTDDLIAREVIAGHVRSTNG